MTVHPYIKFSIVDSLKKSRWSAFPMRNQVAPGWRGILEGMLHCWRTSTETWLETAFFEYFDGREVRGGPPIYKGRTRPEK